jgi:hypothetical protein
MVRTARSTVNAVVFAILVLIVAGGFVWVTYARHQPALLAKARVTPVFTPNGDGFNDVAAVTFMLARPATITVRVLDGQERPVAVLGHDLRCLPWRSIRVRWAGMTAGGRPAPQGRYLVELIEKTQRRRMLLAETIVLKRSRPRARHTDVLAQSR